MRLVVYIESITLKIGFFISAPPLRFADHCITNCPESAPAGRTVHLRCEVYGEATIVWHAPHNPNVPIDEQMQRPDQVDTYTIRASYDQL